MSLQTRDRDFESFDGVRIAWTEAGPEDGRPLVLLHGLFSNANVNWLKFGTAARIAEDSKLLRAARAVLETEPFYRTGLIRPAEGRISGVYGSQRILNGTPGSVHGGLDIANVTGTPIKAAADGVVTLANPGLVLSGGTVLINHGYGLQTSYIHMSRLDVKDGQHVKQGDVIGAIGATGRVTGPHLHFSVLWFDTGLDPETILALMPAKE